MNETESGKVMLLKNFRETIPLVIGHIIPTLLLLLLTGVLGLEHNGPEQLNMSLEESHPWISHEAKNLLPKISRRAYHIK